MKWLLLILASLSFAVHAEESKNFDAIFIKSLNQIHRGKVSEGIKNLRYIFDWSEDKEIKAEIAYLFSVGKYAELVENKLYYARFALKYYTHFEADERYHLLRLIGDLFFKKAELELAKDAFDKIYFAKDAPIDLREYAVYMKGWILVNSDSYTEIFKLWDGWLKDHPTGKLRENILRDYGKFYVEYVTYNKKKAPIKVEAKLAQKDKENLIKGLADGQKKFRMENPALLLGNLAKTQYFTDAAPEIFEHSGYFAKSPCKSITWISKIDPNNQEALQKNAKIINKCYKKLESRGKLKGPQFKNLVALYKKIQFSGAHQYAKAQVLLKGGKTKEACDEFITILLKENLTVDLTKNELVTNSIKGISNTCKNVDSKVLAAEKINGLLAAFNNNPQVFKLYQNNKEINEAIRLTLSAPGMIDNAYAHAAEKGTLLPVEDVIKVFITNASKVDNKRVFDIFHRYELDLKDKERLKIFKNSISGLILEKNYELAHFELDFFSPVELSDTDLVKAWLVLGNSWKTKKAAHFPKVSYIKRFLIDSYLAKGGIAKSEQDLVIYGLLDRDDYKKIIMNWPKFKGKIKSSKDAFLRFTIGASKDINLDEKTLNMVKGDQVINLVKALKKLDQEKVVTSINDLSVPKKFRKLPLAKDFRELKRPYRFERKISKRNFRWGEKTPLVLARYMKDIQYLMRRINRHKWSNQAAYDTSLKYLTNSIDTLVSKLDKMKVPSEAERTQLNAVVEVIKGWRQQL